jgi:hypothetical protein
MRLRRLAASLAAASTINACAHTPAAPRDAEDAAHALARHDGPLALDARGLWLPILDHSVRFVADPGGHVTLLALDVSKDGVAVALRFDGTVRLDGESVASGSGVALVVLDAAGALRRHLVVQGDADEVTRLRLADDGTVLLLRRAGEQRLVHISAAEGKLDFDRREDAPREHLMASDAHAVDEIVNAGELDGPRQGVEPWQAFVEVSRERLGDFRRQVFGSDQPIRLWGVDASFAGSSYVTGTFAGTLDVGGHPPIASPARTPFIAAIDGDGHIAWLAPVFAPAHGAGMEPMGLRADGEGVHLGLMIAAADGSSSFVDATLDEGGGMQTSCELAEAAQGSDVRTLAFGDELTTLVGRFEGALAAAGQPIASYAAPTSAALFFAHGCKLVGRLEAGAGERLVAARPVDERVLVGVDAAGGAELRWYRR